MFTAWIKAAKREATRLKRVDEALRLLQRSEGLGMR